MSNGDGRNEEPRRIRLRTWPARLSLNTRTWGPSARFVIRCINNNGACSVQL